MSFFYAVKNGLQPGIYTNWADCKKQVDGFTSAKYKKFPTRAEALEFISGKSIDTAKTSEGAKAAPSSKKRKKDSEDSNQDYYLESSTARQNFYLDSRHANNNFANNNNEKSEPAKKKTMHDKSMCVQCRFHRQIAKHRTFNRIRITSKA